MLHEDAANKGADLVVSNLDKLPGEATLLLDRIMPALRGYDGRSSLKSNSRFGEIPIIMTSALSEAA